MEEKNRRHVMIISPSKNMNESSKATAKLKLKKGSGCTSHLLCIIADCLSCESCLYSLNYKDREYKSEAFDMLDKEVVEYSIDFFDDVDFDKLFSNGNILEYLCDDSNDYRVTRLKDGVIVKLNHADWDRLNEFDRKMAAIEKAPASISSYTTSENDDIESNKIKINKRNK